jgi:hypothetical protein
VIFSKMGNHYDLAMVLAHLGETYMTLDNVAGAREAWEESLLILREFHHPSAPTVRGRLAAISPTRPPAAVDAGGPADADRAERQPE